MTLLTRPEITTFNGKKSRSQSHLPCNNRQYLDFLECASKPIILKVVRLENSITFHALTEYALLSKLAAKLTKTVTKSRGVREIEAVNSWLSSSL